MTDAAGPALAWVVVPSDQVPERWAGRARPVALVPLLPDEVARLLAGDAPGPELDAVEEELAGLVAQRMTDAAIASATGTSLRSVQRRVARLRRRLGASSKAELIRKLTELGFG